jgi:predicted outer membrane repeat protein
MFARWTAWLKRPFASPCRRRAHCGRRVLQLELLEERRLLAAFTVSSLADSGPGSLRQAILDAENSYAGQANTITFTGQATQGTIYLTEALPTLTGQIDIEGSWAGKLTVERAPNAVIPDFRIFDVQVGATVTIDGLTITNGSAPNDSGGGILNQGTLVLSNSTVAENSAFDGGGIANGGTLTLRASTVSDNAADGSFSLGGGIYNRGTLAISGSTIAGNQADSAAGVYSSGTLTVDHSTISGNKAADGQGGLKNDSGAATIDSSIISGNSAGGGDGGGIANLATMTLTNSSISGNSANGGGGIVNLFSQLTIRDCAIFANTASGGPSDVYQPGNGGGLASSGQLTIDNSTFSGNSAVGDGGGISTTPDVAPVQITSTTITANTADSDSDGQGAGGGLFVSAGTTVALHNTLIAGNFVSPGKTSVPSVSVPDLAGSVVSLGYNVIGDGTGSSGLANWVNGDQVGTGTKPLAAHLGALEDNGGPTPTCAELFGSPALGKGDPSLAGSTDQRGQPRPAQGVDVGAFQHQGAATLTVTSSGDDVGDSQGLTLRDAVALVEGQMGLGDLTAAERADVQGDPGVLDTIVLDVTGVITLTQALPDLTGSGTIDGPGAAKLTIQRSTDPNTPAFSIFNVTQGAIVTLVGVTLSNGKADASGGSDGSDDRGGAIRVNSSYLGVRDCVLSNNASPTYGGAIDNAGGTVFLTRTALVGNSAAYWGGGYSGSGVLNAHDCTIAGNQASDGGGLNNYQGQVTLVSSTVANNTATYEGGGFVGYQGSVLLQLCTFWGNKSGDSGGGLYGDGVAFTLDQLTITANTANSDQVGSGFGGGILVFNDTGTPAQSTLHNCLIAGNFDLKTPGQSNTIEPDAVGTFTTLGYNLIGDGTGLTFANANNHDQIGTAKNPLVALLAALGSYGGLTPTCALLPGSPAIGNGDPALAGSSDQRGVHRPRSGSPDVGAFQSQGFTISVQAGNNQNVPLHNPFTLTVLVTANAAGEPVAGGLVTFTSPPTTGSSGAGATFGAPVLIGSNGQASATGRANGVVGKYSIAAIARGATEADFFLSHVANLSLSATKLSFGSQMVGTTSATQTVTLSNAGSVAVSLGSVSVSGDFVLGGLPKLPTTLAGGASVSFTVAFRPTAVGSRSGLLSVQEGSDSPQTITLSGTGTAALLLLSTSASSVTEGSTVTLSGTLPEPGTAKGYKVSINWGDGSASTTLNLSAGVLSFQASHVYAEEGRSGQPYGIIVGARTGQVSYASAAQVSVTDAALTASAASVSATAGQAFSGVVGTFSDAGGGSLADYTVTIDWGDGTASYPDITHGTLSGPDAHGVWTVTGTHTYSKAQSYTIHGHISDRGGASADFSETVVVSPVADKKQGKASQTIVAPTVAPVSQATTVSDALFSTAGGSSAGLSTWGVGQLDRAALAIVLARRPAP